MKKLSLTQLNLSSSEVLLRSQLSLILGGYDSGGTCGYKAPNGEVWCNLSHYTATRAQMNNGGYYCCDSCGSNGGSASYC